MAQVPQSFKYQAVLRDNTGEVIADVLVDIKISILQIEEVMYVETYNVITNQFGLITLNVGEGTLVIGIFADIEWGVAEHSIKVEVNHGSGYVEYGTSQLLSVLYALYAENVVNGGDGLWQVSADSIFVLNRKCRNWNKCSCNMLANTC